MPDNSMSMHQMARRRLHVCFEAVSTSLFPMALGLAGTGAAWRGGAATFGADWMDAIGVVLLIGGGVALTGILLAYLTKAATAIEEVAMDLASPNTANLLAPGLMAGAVLGSQLSAYTEVGNWIWAVAATAHVLLLITFVGRWVAVPISSEELTPTWFLPSAGLMTSSLTWPGLGSELIPWMIAAVGGTAWLIMLPLVFRRLVFEPALEPSIRPSLIILSAPFGLASATALTIGGTLSPWIALFLVTAGSFFVAVLIVDWKFLIVAGFTLSWWAATFPLAVLATVWLRLSSELETGLRVPGVAFLIGASAAVVAASVATVAVTAAGFSAPLRFETVEDSGHP